MADLVFDEKVGWYDPDEEYCCNGDGNRATTGRFTGMTGRFAQIELICAECAAEPGTLIETEIGV